MDSATPTPPANVTPLSTSDRDDSRPGTSDEIKQQSAVSDSSVAPATTVNIQHSGKTFVDSKGRNLIYSPDHFEEKEKGIAGRFVKKLGVLSYFLFFIFPLAYVAIFFAIIPLGDPKIETISEQWVFIFISNVFVMLAIAYLYNAAFLALAECERPFRTSLIPLVSVVLTQIAVMTPIYLIHGVFPWVGIVALATCYITLFLSMFFAYPEHRTQLHSFFRRFMVLLILYIPLLSGFVIAYRNTDSSLGQAGLSFAFALATFIYRRIMLSRLDPFPLEYAQLYAGFWVQNLGDCTSVLSLPQTNSPNVLIAVFFANSSANVAFLIFVSDLWIYRIRPYLKTYVKNAFKCNFPLPPIPEPDESFDPYNRGHDLNTGGYRRRQFRFFFFRLLSQAVSMFFYLGISPMLRFGFNEFYTPLGAELKDGQAVLESHEYRNSIIYAAVNLGFILVVAILGYAYLNRAHKETFRQIREIHRHDLVHHTLVGEIIAIITHNMILTIAIILTHYCIFASSDDCKILPRD